MADKLHFGVTELVACTWLHAYLRAIKATYPALNIKLTVGLSRRLNAEFQANRLDLVIQKNPFASPANAVIELGEFPYVWVAQHQITGILAGQNTVADLLPHCVLTHARHTQAYLELPDIPPHWVCPLPNLWPPTVLPPVSGWPPMVWA